MEKSRICLNELTNKELAENLKMLIGAYEKQECPEDVRKYKESLAYLEKVWEKKEQDIRGEAKTGNPVPDQRIWTSG